MVAVSTARNWKHVIARGLDQDRVRQFARLSAGIIHVREPSPTRRSAETRLESVVLLSLFASSQLLIITRQRAVADSAQVFTPRKLI